MTPAAFWAWVWRMNLRRPHYLTRQGNIVPPSKSNLSEACGLTPARLRQMQYRNLYPTVAIGRSLARELGIPFDEVNKRAKLRLERDHVQTCLNCTLPECEATSKHCPLGLRFSG